MFPQKDYVIPAQIILHFSQLTKLNHKGKENTHGTLNVIIFCSDLQMCYIQPKWTAIDWLLFERELWFAHGCAFLHVIILTLQWSSRKAKFLGRISQMEMETGHSHWEGSTEVVGVGGELLDGREVWELVMMKLESPLSYSACVGPEMLTVYWEPQEALWEIKSMFPFGSINGRPSRWPST